MPARGLLALLFCSVAALSAAAAQTAAPSVAEGVALTIRSVDDLEQSWGLRTEELLDAAGQGVRAGGWSVNDHSGSLITVELILLAQQDEDLFPLRVSVRGSRSVAAADTGDSQLTPPEVTASRVIEVPWSDHARILSTVKRMVGSVARKMIADFSRRKS